jgi:hypothetical protein
MLRDIEFKYKVDLADEALEIIVRRRPDLRGKTLDEARALIREEFRDKRVPDQKAPTRTDE